MSLFLGTTRKGARRGCTLDLRLERLARGGRGPSGGGGRRVKKTQNCTKRRPGPAKEGYDSTKWGNEEKS